MATNKNKINLRDMTKDDIHPQLDKAKEDLFKLHFRAITAPLKNTMQIRALKRNIARYNTFINMRTVSQNGPVNELKHRNGSKQG